MTFLMLATLIVVTGVVAFIAWPLLRARRGGARSSPRMSTGGWIALACAPALAAVIYVLAGSPGSDIRQESSMKDAIPAKRGPLHGLDRSQVAANAERLAARLRESPEDAQGWAMLARSLAALGRFQEAAAAFGEATARLPGNATMLADHADVLAMAQGRRFAGEPDRLIQAALDADPRHPKALVLAGSSAFDRGDFATAANYWRRYLLVVPRGEPLAREVEERAREAERRAAAVSGRSLSGTVAFAAGEGRPLEPGDVVFVVARPRDGRGRPVAVSRVPVSSLPTAFRLDDGDSLLAASPLSGFSEVTVEARLSRNGVAEPRPGNPRSAQRAAKPGDRAIALELRLPRG